MKKLETQPKALQTNTQEKIKNAARIVFHKKGYAATRTRDIAEEAGMNLALLNYYFRSKEKLFNIIMLETFEKFIQGISSLLNDEKTTLEEKVELIVESYINLIIKEPDIPIFVVSEIRNNADMLLEKIPFKDLYFNSSFFQQYQKAVAEKKVDDVNPLQFFLNLLGLIVFPFIVKPMLQRLSNLDDEQFNRIMQERKKLIPVWIKSIVKQN